MRHPDFKCAACGGVHLRRSHINTLMDLPRMALGIYPFRCLDCRARFWMNIWLFSKGKQAMCPRCLAIEVAPVAVEGMRLNLLKRLMLAVGARGYRCLSCNRRFLSFRRASDANSLPSALPSEKTQAAEAMFAAKGGE